MTTINVGANTTSSTTHAAGTTWGNRRVRLLAVKPSLAQAPPKKSAAMASREAIVHPIVNSGATDGQVLPLASVTSTSTASENGEATSMPPAVIVPVKQPPVSAPAVLQRQRAASEAAITVAAAVAATANLNTQMQLRRAPLAVRPLAAMGSNGYHGTMSSGSTTSASEHCTGTTTPNTVGSPSSERNSPDCTAPASTPFNLNDGRPSLWARRSSLVTKKSGEIVKPSLKIKTRGMKPRSKSEPTTPTKFVHFDAQICRVRFFRHVESPRSVAGTESEGENTESEDSDSEDEAFRSSSSSFINGHSRIEDTLEQGDRAVEEAQGLRSGEYRLQLVNLPETSVFHLTMRPISIEWIRLAGNARHLRVLTCCQNIAFHKAVTIRYTFDNWQTQEDISGEFYDSISNGGFDRFLACIPIYDMLAANSQSNATQTMEPLVVELCVRYLVDGKEFWDNNRGSNYRVIVTRSPITTNNSYQQRMIMNPNDGYFSLPALTAHHQDRRRHQHHQDRTSSERKRIQQDAEKAWQQVLMKSRTEDDDDDERDVLPIQQRRFKPSTAASRQSTAMTTSNTATGTTQLHYSY
ncbi:putative phosphatase regulatory subunit-domain-containing protein [Syncephalis plumigaleata]|nr:putative phosphatase regulatory subunit-domain-containing protein [Syncephalis plumigaleata]